MSISSKQRVHRLKPGAQVGKLGGLPIEVVEHMFIKFPVSITLYGRFGFNFSLAFIAYNQNAAFMCIAWHYNSLYIFAAHPFPATSLALQALSGHRIFRPIHLKHWPVIAWMLIAAIWPGRHLLPAKSAFIFVVQKFKMCAHYILPFPVVEGYP
jgi:hypothetical protein